LLHLLPLKFFLCFESLTAASASNSRPVDVSPGDFVVPLLLPPGPHLMAAAILAVELDIDVVARPRGFGV
jgi:hypothetical protein